MVTAHGSCGSTRITSWPRRSRCTAAPATSRSRRSTTSATPTTGSRSNWPERQSGRRDQRRRPDPAADPRPACVRRRHGQRRARRVPQGDRHVRGPDRRDRDRDPARIGDHDARRRTQGPPHPAPHLARGGDDADGGDRHRVRSDQHLLGADGRRPRRHAQPERRRRQPVPADGAGTAPGHDARRPPHGDVRPVRAGRLAGRRRRARCAPALPDWLARRFDIDHTTALRIPFVGLRLAGGRDRASLSAALTRHRAGVDGAASRCTPRGGSCTGSPCCSASIRSAAGS